MNNYFRAAIDIVSHQGIFAFCSLSIRELYRLIFRQFFRSSYAQNWEDLEISRVLKNKPKGFYIDIGAHHPHRLSNTFHFYKKGWTGITVEPNTEVKKIFEDARPRDIHLAVGIGKKEGKMPFYRFRIPALSTFSAESAQDSQSRGYSVEKVEEVPIFTVDRLYSYLPGKTAIDVLSLDTEGWDYQIIAAWNFKKFAPQLICIEEGIDIAKSEKLLKEEGYKQVFSNGINSLFLYQGPFREN